MSVKRFVAADMRRALELVREEMGPNAIILSSKRTKGGVEILTTSEPQPGNPQLDAEQAANAAREIAAASQSFATTLAETAKGEQQSSLATTAAMAANKPAYRFEPPEQPRQRRPQSRPQETRPQQPLSEPMVAQHVSASLQLANWQYEPGQTQVAFQLDPQVWGQPQAAPVDDGMDDQFNELRAEIMGMREMLQSQLSQWSQGGQSPVPQHTDLPSTVATVIQRRLVQMGLSAKVIKACLGRIKPGVKLADAWAEALAYLAHRLPVSPQDRLAQGGIFAFVGAPGAGKTATIAKLAARQVLAQGPAGVALVSATRQVAGGEQLQRLGRILNVPVYQVDQQHSLASILRQLGDKSLVLIDTPAASTESGAVNQLKQLRQAAGVPIKTYWVLAADASEAALREQAQRYCHGRLAGCVVTRMDCAQRLGPLFGLLLETGVAIGYTCQGPAMPQEVQVARAHQLITKAVSLLKTRGQGGKQPLPGPQTTRPSHAKRPGHASASDRTGLAVS